MRNKFFTHKKPKIKNLIDYLMRWRSDATEEQKATVNLLRGDPLFTQNFVEQLAKEKKKKQNFSAGVLSFEELHKDISEDIKDEIMDSFENMLFPNIANDRFNILWIEHFDKDGRLELNWVIPENDLLTKKKFTNYLDAQDKQLFDSWQKLINEKYGFSQVANPYNKAIHYNKRMPQKSLHLIEEILSNLNDEFLKKNIKNQNDTIEFLKKNDVEVVSAGNDGITIDLEKNNIHQSIKGLYFEKDFNIDEMTRQPTYATDTPQPKGNNREEWCRKQHGISENVEFGSNKYFQIMQNSFNENIKKRIARHKKNFKVTQAKQRLLTEELGAEYLQKTIDEKILKENLVNQMIFDETETAQASNTNFYKKFVPKNEILNEKIGVQNEQSNTTTRTTTATRKTETRAEQIERIQGLTRNAITKQQLIRRRNSINNQPRNDGIHGARTRRIFNNRIGKIFNRISKLARTPFYKLFKKRIKTEENQRNGRF